MGNRDEFVLEEVGAVMRAEARWIAGLALLMLASTAAANAGTPLLWLGCCWLFLGNWAIGRFECWVMRRVVLVDPVANKVAVLGRGRSPSTLLDPGVPPARQLHRLSSEREYYEVPDKK